MSYTNTQFELNGISYSDAKITFNGVNLPGVRALNVTINQEKTNKFGAGVYAVARGRGVKDVTGSIDMDLETRNILKNTFAPLTDLTDVLPGLITVVFSSTGMNGGTINNVVRVTAVEFTSDGCEMGQNDDEIVRSYDFVAGLFLTSAV